MVFAQPVKVNLLLPEWVVKIRDKFQVSNLPSTVASHGEIVVLK